VAGFSTKIGGPGARTLTANGGASYDPDGGDSGVRWSWNFGDGTSAVTTTPTTTYTYAATGPLPGTWTVVRRPPAGSR